MTVKYIIGLLACFLTHSKNDRLPALRDEALIGYYIPTEHIKLRLSFI